MSAMARIDELTAALKPSLASAITGVATLGNLAVWQELIKAWSAIAIAIIAVPTAFCMLVYWLFKMRRAFLDRNKTRTWGD